MGDRSSSVTGYVTTTPKIELDDPLIVAWLTYLIEEAEPNAPQFPPTVARTFAWVKRLHMHNLEVASRAVERRIENGPARIESGAMVAPMTTAEVMRELDLESTQRVTQLRAEGRLTGSKRGRVWLIDRQSVEAEKARRSARGDT